MHQQIEAMKIAVHAASQHFADARAMFVSPEQLLEPGSQSERPRVLGIGQRCCLRFHYP